MTREYFEGIERLQALSPDDTTDSLGYRVYRPEQLVLGKSMADHLRMAVCYWHTFCWPGDDTFGSALFERPWHGGETVADAHMKLEAAFEFMEKLGLPYFTFHDTDVAAQGDTPKQTSERFKAMLQPLQEAMERTGVRLLWGTANLFGSPRYAAGASTNPDPEVFACAALQVRDAMEGTLALGGENYVLWGGREGYDTLLNTDMRREQDQLGRFMSMVAEHKHKIGFRGALLIEPKPMEPTKHQYDFDTATVHAFLQKYDLADEFRVNIEVNHATLAGHDFQHELAYAVSNGILGSVDANRGDSRLGWDTDQFPTSVEEMTLALYTILRGGGLGSGGFNFDAKLRRQSLDPVDLFHAHAGAADTLALSLLKAASLIEEGSVPRFIEQRYAAWQGELGQLIHSPASNLSSLADHTLARELNPKPRSGRQELLENQVTRRLHQP